MNDEMCKIILFKIVNTKEIDNKYLEENKLCESGYMKLIYSTPENYPPTKHIPLLTLYLHYKSKLHLHLVNWNSQNKNITRISIHHLKKVKKIII